MRDVDVFIEHCQDQGHAIATINRRVAALSSFYRYLAMMSDEAPANPVRLGLHFLHQGRQLPRDVEDRKLEHLFAAIDSLRDRAMFLLMLRCGLRVEKVRNLSMNELYLYPVSGGLPRLWLHGKGDKERVMYLSSQAMTALEICPNGSEQAVFVNRSGKHLTVTGIQLQLASYCKCAEMPTGYAPEVDHVCVKSLLTFDPHSVPATDTGFHFLSALTIFEPRQIGKKIHSFDFPGAFGIVILWLPCFIEMILKLPILIHGI